MKCPKCGTDQPPVESGPYAFVHVKQVVVLVCPECDSTLGFLPAAEDEQKAA